ncbi:hypothetical protein Y032_0097g3037 [Ancylostoma ceylanicum]|uniref:Uncharacterized protein n=1 Tax=Ancylostoma ceylanicum TaxID=53326 RepID=A0A016TIZ7_9BILA|nr:hypothetical protein Y032_0097g3037 [Ancylostoma ceylanicum]
MNINLFHSRVVHKILNTKKINFDQGEKSTDAVKKEQKSLTIRSPEKLHGVKNASKWLFIQPTQDILWYPGISARIRVRDHSALPFHEATRTCGI